MMLALAHHRESGANDSTFASAYRSACGENASSMLGPPPSRIRILCAFRMAPVARISQPAAPPTRKQPTIGFDDTVRRDRTYKQRPPELPEVVRDLRCALAAVGRGCGLFMRRARLPLRSPARAAQYAHVGSIAGSRIDRKPARG